MRAVTDGALLTSNCRYRQAGGASDRVDSGEGGSMRRERQDETSTSNNQVVKRRLSDCWYTESQQHKNDKGE